MINPKNISDLVHDILDNLPVGLKNLPVDLQHNLRSALHSAFEKLDLVTREEFEAQCKVLLRTREKLELLEKRLAEMDHPQKHT